MPQILPLPLVNLMDLLTSALQTAATDFAAGQPMESKGQLATEYLKQWEGRKERNASQINHQAVQGEQCPCK